MKNIIKKACEVPVTTTTTTTTTTPTTASTPITVIMFKNEDAIPASQDDVISGSRTLMKIHIVLVCSGLVLVT